MRKILAALVVVAAFAAGFHVDRALHRPLVIQWRCTLPRQPKVMQPDIKAQIKLFTLISPSPTLMQDGPKPLEFAEMNEAALYAVALSYKITPYYEVGGVIVRLKDGKYAIGHPHSDFRGDAVNFNLDPDAYEGVIVGDYHTHPCLSYTHVPASFSDQDLLNYRMMHVTGYMLDECTGLLHTFIEGVDSRDEGPMGDGDVPGRIVGHIPVTGIQLDAGTPRYIVD